MKHYQVMRSAALATVLLTAVFSPVSFASLSLAIRRMNIHRVCFHLGYMTMLLVLVCAPLASAAEAPSLLWKVASPLFILRTPALGDDGHFYTIAFVASAAGPGVASLDPADGSILWGPVIPAGCAHLGNAPSVSVGPNGLLYAVGDWNECGNGRLVAFNSTNGTIAWDHGDCPGGGNTSPHPRQTPALDETFNSLYFGSASLCSVNMDSGVNHWSVGGGLFVGEGGMAIDTSSDVYYGTNSGGSSANHVRSYSRGGIFRWARDVGERGSQIMAILSDGTILIHTQLGANVFLTALDSNGSDRWQVANLTHPVTDAPGRAMARSGLR